MLRLQKITTVGAELEFGQSSPIGLEPSIVAKNKRPSEQLAGKLLWLCALLLASLVGLASGSQPLMQSYRDFMDNLKRSDKCGALFKSRKHGYELQEYKVITNDNYELVIHRLIHPADLIAERAGRPKQLRKPYLLLHGLLGTSASFLDNVREMSPAPSDTYDLNANIKLNLNDKPEEYKYLWQPTAERARGTNDDTKIKPKDSSSKQHPNFASLIELNFENDADKFGSAFRQAYRKFHLPKESYQFTRNSLAFTLANFGYDVWLINMRGNQYSRGYRGQLRANQAEYWNFNIEQLVKEDLLASLSLIKREKGVDDPIGLISYSYSSIHVLNLLTKFSSELVNVQPIVMIAPTLLTANSNPDRIKRKALQLASNMLVSRNGPFPSLGRSVGSGSSKERLESAIESIICKLPVLSKLCSFLETILHGRTKNITSVKGLLLSDGQEHLIRRETECGQTSRAILHRIIGHLANPRVMPQFDPQSKLVIVQARKEFYRRSVILVHSQGDLISTPAEVEKLRNYALRDLVLADYQIETPNFGHTDFLFSPDNQYLVNAEIVRMVALYDHLIYRPSVQAMLAPRRVRQPLPTCRPANKQSGAQQPCLPVRAK